MKRGLPLILICCLWPATADADGGFKGLVAKPVEIPQQIAVMSYGEGKETLTIWNTVQAESAELAWVLPLGPYGPNGDAGGAAA